MDITFSKPKKIDGTFICTIKKQVVLNLSGSQLIHIKEIRDQTGSYIIFLKNKNLCNYMYDLNQRIIELVKENCTTWFNTNMNPDLIDDYYTSTLIYDKTHGELIKIKIIGQEEDKLSDSFIGNNLNLELNAFQLRFYKQKFVLECKINNCETACDIIEFASDDEDGHNDYNADATSDVAYPSPSELEEMKTEVFTKTESKIKSLEVQVTELQNEILKFSDIKQKMEEAREIDDIIKVFNEFFS